MILYYDRRHPAAPAPPARAKDSAGVTGPPSITSSLLFTISFENSLPAACGPIAPIILFLFGADNSAVRTGPMCSSTGYEADFQLKPSRQSRWNRAIRDPDTAFEEMIVMLLPGLLFPQRQVSLRAHHIEQFREEARSG
jgi:hypothetical protein